MSNMTIWDAVSKTDPKHTKKVAFGRKFTAIDAHYQVMKATEQFGPVGDGWGYHCEHGIEGKLAWCDVLVWWGDEDKTHQFGPIRGMAEITTAKSPDRVDTDAPKKAMTDALTKGLSHLGFSADVFLGLFDDNKYLSERTKASKDKEWAVEVGLKLSKSKDIAELDERMTKLEPHLEGRDEDAVQYIRHTYLETAQTMEK